MAKLFLFRHGSTGPSARGRYIGSTDLPLHEEAFTGLNGWRGRLPATNRILCSPMLRARQTAQRLGIDAPEIIPDLREIDFGQCEGLTFDEIERRFTNTAASLLDGNADAAFPGGESSTNLNARVSGFLQREFGTDAAGDDSSALLITHAGVIRSILTLALGLSPAQAWRMQAAVASLGRIDYTPAGSTLAFWNWTAPSWPISIS